MSSYNEFYVDLGEGSVGSSGILVRGMAGNRPVLCAASMAIRPCPVSSLSAGYHNSISRDRRRRTRGHAPFILPIRLTLTPTMMTQRDADAVFAAGWDERALYDAVQICCLCNFMNRFVEGLGLTPRPDQFDMEGKLIKEGDYAGMATTFGIK